MMTCDLLSDRMTTVVRGEAQWTGADRDHLESCRDCSAEWDLVRGAASLGDDLAELDTSRLAQRVMDALRVPSSRPSLLRHLRWAIPAALAASLLFVLVRRDSAGPDPEPAVPVMSLLPEVEGLTAGELETVLRLLPTADPGDLRGPEDLNEDELTQMLKDMEG